MTLNVIDYAVYGIAMLAVFIQFTVSMLKQGSMSAGELLAGLLVAFTPFVNHVVAAMCVLSWIAALIDNLKDFTVWRRK